MSKLLLIEPDPEFRSLCAALLAHAGHHVTELEALPPSPPSEMDLLLIDPGTDIAAGTERARRFAGEAPLLIMTGGVVRPWCKQSLRGGGPDCRMLSKPFTASALLGTVESLLRSHAGTQVTAQPAGAGGGTP